MSNHRPYANYLRLRIADLEHEVFVALEPGDRHRESGRLAGRHAAARRTALGLRLLLGSLPAVVLQIIHTSGEAVGGEIAESPGGYSFIRALFGPGDVVAGADDPQGRGLWSAATALPGAAAGRRATATKSDHMTTRWEACRQRVTACACLRRKLQFRTVDLTGKLTAARHRSRDRAVAQGGPRQLAGTAPGSFAGGAAA